MKRFLSALLALVLLLALPAFADGAPEMIVREIQKYGNLVLDIAGTDFLGLGFDYGDVVSAEIAGRELEMPVCSSYSDVDEGSPVCRVVVDDASGDDTVILAINMGDLASVLGIAEKVVVDEEPGYRWDYLPGVETPVSVKISMLERGGYADQYMIIHLVRTNERTDYPHLTDEQFANFRAVATSGMGEGMLYRTSSPINPEIGRNKYADTALAAAGVRTVVNLADSEAVMRGYEGYADSAYAACNIIALNLGVDILGEEFRAGIAEGLRHMIVHEGPYVIHCTEGKDRAGFASALLECLMGASFDEVIADYMATFCNYYGVEPGTEKYDIIVFNNIEKILASAFGVKDIRSADLTAEAEEYLTEAGLAPDEIALLKKRLAGT